MALPFVALVALVINFKKRPRLVKQSVTGYYIWWLRKTEVLKCVYRWYNWWSDTIAAPRKGNSIDGDKAIQPGCSQYISLSWPYHQQYSVNTCPLFGTLLQGTSYWGQVLEDMAGMECPYTTLKFDYVNTTTPGHQQALQRKRMREKIESELQNFYISPYNFFPSASLA